MEPLLWVPPHTLSQFTPPPLFWRVLGSRGTPMGRLPSRLALGGSLVDFQLPLKELPGASHLEQAVFLRPLMVGLAHFLFLCPPSSRRAWPLLCSPYRGLCSRGYAWRFSVGSGPGGMSPSFRRPGPSVGRGGVLRSSASGDCGEQRPSSHAHS